MNEQQARVAAVILAAGASGRLGQPKQLLQMEGESLLRRTARVALASGCEPVFAVLGFEAPRMALELAGLPIQAVVNEDWASGMASSLRQGVLEALATRPKVDALLLLVCDQPHLSVAHLGSLLAAHRQAGQPITASEYDGKAGVPAVLARSICPELLLLEGDAGAREVIRRDPARMKTVAWPPGLIDVDLPEDLPGLPLRRT